LLLQHLEPAGAVGIEFGQAINFAGKANSADGGMKRKLKSVYILAY
jgi:hypothetical protein